MSTNNGDLPKSSCGPAIVRSPGFLKAIIKIMSDGRWYTSTQLTEALREVFAFAKFNTASNAICHMSRQPPDGMELVKKRIGRRFQYRLRATTIGSRVVPARILTELAEKARPIIEDLKRWGSHNQYEMSPSAILGLAVRLEKLFASIEVVTSTTTT